MDRCSTMGVGTLKGELQDSAEILQGHYAHSLLSREAAAHVEGRKPSEYEVRLSVPFDTQIYEDGAPITDVFVDTFRGCITLRFGLAYDPEEDEGPMTKEDLGAWIAQLQHIRNLVSAGAAPVDVLGQIDKLLDDPHA